MWANNVLFIVFLLIGIALLGHPPDTNTGEGMIIEDINEESAKGKVIKRKKITIKLLIIKVKIFFLKVKLFLVEQNVIIIKLLILKIKLILKQ